MLKIMPPFLGALLLSIFVHIIAYQQDVFLQGIAFERYTALPNIVFGFSNLVYNSLTALPFIAYDFARQLVGTDFYIFVRYISAVQVEMAFYTILFLIIAISGRNEWSERIRWDIALAVLVALIVLNEFIWRFPYDFQFAPYFLFGALVYIGSTEIRISLLVIVVALVLLGIHQSHFITDTQLFTEQWWSRLGEVKRQRALALFALLVVCFLALRYVRLPFWLAKLDRSLAICPILSI